jgi:hypothetical protein
VLCRRSLQCGRNDGLGDNEALAVELRQFKDELNFLSHKGRQAR